MNLEHFIVVTLYVCLAIVAMSAVVCLLHLVRVVRVPLRFENKLFTAVILAAVSLVFWVVRSALRPEAPSASAAILEGSWDWTYPERSWRTEAAFTNSTDGIRFSATTYDVGSPGKRVPLVVWRTPKPVKLAWTGRDLTFGVNARLTQYAEQAGLNGPVDKDIPGKMRLVTGVALSGGWNADDSPDGAHTWGIVLTRAMR